jgi:ATP-dependent DNA helicase RecG
MAEGQILELKDIKILEEKSGLKKIAAECVALANAQGGEIRIGIDDKTHTPPADQRIPSGKLSKILKTIHDNAINISIGEWGVSVHENGGEYLRFVVLPSNHVLASTADGRVLIRLDEHTLPVTGEDLTRLAREKPGFYWEVQMTDIPLSEASPEEKEAFTKDIHQSSKVSEFIKRKSGEDLFEHYKLCHNGKLTNLGVLWLGTSQQRAGLYHSLVAEYIVFDASGQKQRKEIWQYHQHNPKALLQDIESKAVELSYFDEMPHGLFRRQLRHYDRDVIRELFVNAIAHRSYLQSGMISIAVYTDRMIISSPGGLPLGITPENILRQRGRRNPHLLTVLHDLNLMEAEGSGYDLIFERLARDAKPFPVIQAETNQVSVTVFVKSIYPEVLNLMDYINDHFQLSQNEVIAIGVVAGEKKINATDLSKRLQLTDDQRHHMLSGLIDKGILKLQGATKGASYLLSDALLRQASMNIRPSLKTLEPHVLETLILKDLEIHSPASSQEIQSRLPEVALKDIQRILYRLEKNGAVLGQGVKRYKKYTHRT